MSMFEDLQMVIKGESPIPEYSYPSLAHVVAFFWENQRIELKGRQIFKILEGIVLGLFNLSNLGLEHLHSSYSYCSTLI